MQEKNLLSKAEQVLSMAWGDSVHLSLLEQQEEHKHVLRLAVQGDTLEVPQTVILKRWRVQGEERFNADHSVSHFFNDWAGLEFLSSVLGDEVFTPQIYGGDQAQGFLLIEDLLGTEPLNDALWNQNPAKATEVLIRYGEILGLLHGKTWGHLDTYNQIRDRLSEEHQFPKQDYLIYLQEAIKTLEKLSVAWSALPPEDVAEAAEILSQPGNFAAFTHGDPVFSNIINWQGRWYLIDFEAARFRHALLEGSYPRLFFPTSGLKYVLRIPEPVWRQAETAYRHALGQYHPAAKNDADYGSEMMAACAFWVLDVCHSWLERAIVGNGPPVMIKRIRQSIIARFETFIMTSREYQSGVRIGNVFEKVVKELRANWPEEDCDLPVYPAFS